MKKGDRRITSNGNGSFSGNIDQPESNNPRFGFILDNNPFNYPIAYYRKDELLKINPDKEE